MEVVTERLLHIERKLTDMSTADDKAMSASTTWRRPRNSSLRCLQCKKLGQIQRNCSKQSTSTMPNQDLKHKGKKVGFVIQLGLGATSQTCKWIGDLGATFHISNNKDLFVDFKMLPKSQKVTLGDERTLEAKGIGTVEVKLILPIGNILVRSFSNVLFVPDLAYNLMSFTQMTELENQVIFNEENYQIFNKNSELVALAN